MNKICVLDCTLRDGGYCNQWMFYQENIVKIIDGLADAGVDVIEMGFISDAVQSNKDATLYSSFAEASSRVPRDKGKTLYVCMINYGEFNADNIPDCADCRLDGIRVAFHKKDADAALAFCRKIKDKGYKVFVQAMVSLNYSDEEFIALLHQINALSPYAFYIVDSFGSMSTKQVVQYFYLTDAMLDGEIIVGFHSHNNMQLAPTNAQTLVEMPTKRTLLIDTSVMGMGRGAGNLNTELFIRYLNMYYDEPYSIKPVLTLIDETINSFYQKKPWGYSLPNYLSASHNVHPNYAGYLNEKQTLTIEAMHDIFSSMDEERKNTFDKAYIEDLYIRYMASEQTQESRLHEFAEGIRNKSVLLVAPGKSTVTERGKLIDFVNRNSAVVISVNHCCECVRPDFIFVSNLRRFKNIPAEDREKCIVTSNIPAADVYLKTKYKPLLNHVDFVQDNAGLMLIRFLMMNGVKEVYLAGFDGYSHDADANYSDDKIALVSQNALLDARNEGVKSVLRRYAEHIRIHFLTSTKYLENDSEMYSALFGK